MTNITVNAKVSPCHLPVNVGLLSACIRADKWLCHFIQNIHILCMAKCTGMLFCLCRKLIELKRIWVFTDGHNSVCNFWKYV